MKSGKQRRIEIMARRRERLTVQTMANVYALPLHPLPRPSDAVPANRGELMHNNTYGPLPLFYVARPFVCRDCQAPQVWTAKQQKWWYETAKGNINSFAVRCRPCRNRIQTRKAEARRVHLEGMASKARAGEVRAERQ